jgi:hypothetical protein
VSVFQRADLFVKSRPLRMVSPSGDWWLEFVHGSKAAERTGFQFAAIGA